jgi:imidazolonepropionase-like amidohydrolase
MQLWLRDLSSGVDRQLTSGAPGVRYPAFSPDGASIAFQQVGPRGDQDFSIRLLTLADGAGRSLPAPPLWPGRMSWSGDGRRLLVSVLVPASRRSREGVNRIALIDVADGALRWADLPDGLAPESGPVISPDGRLLALIAAGAPWIVPVTPAGELAGTPRELRAELADYPSWSGDSRSLHYLSLRGLVRADLATGKAVVLRTRLRWQPPAPPGRLIVHAGRVWDGESDGYRRDVDVHVEDGRIVAVREHAPHGSGVPVIDAATSVVLPGLMENHAHHQAHDGEWVGRAWLAFGVTSVVEPGGLPYESRELLESWDGGARPGPRLFMAGPQLDGERRYFPFASHVTSERRLAWELERARALDYALIKTYTRMTPARQADLIRRAHRLGLPVSSHEIYPALAVGGDRVEHLRGTSRAGFSSKQSDLLHSYADVVGIVSAPGAAISPTLVVSGGFFSHWLAHPTIAQNLQYRRLYPEAYRNGLSAFAQLVGRKRALLDEGTANARAAIHALRRSGARIVAGTDAPIFPYGLSLVVELAGYVEAGLTPAEALRTATSQSADALGVGRDLGRVRAGMLADLVIVDGDPLGEITDLLRVDGVIRGGRHYPLDELLCGPDAP